MFMQNLKNRIMGIYRPYSALVQQGTAGIIIAYLLFVVGFLVMSPNINYYHWRYFITGQLMASFSTLFLLSLCWKSWSGLEVMIRSYFRPSYMRSVLLTGSIALNLFYYAWGVSIIWNIYI